MRLRAILTAGVAVTLAIGTAVVATPSASAQGAPIVWYQAVAVPTATSPCPVTTDGDKAKGWTDWTNSYAEWPNGGKGGNVCSRSITWAYERDAASGSAFPSGGCQKYSDYYVNYGGGYSAPAGSSAYILSDCTSFTGNTVSRSVYAPAPYNPNTLCVAAFGTNSNGQWPNAVDVYRCL